MKRFFATARSWRWAARVSGFGAFCIIFGICFLWLTGSVFNFSRFDCEERQVFRFCLYMMGVIAIFEGFLFQYLVFHSIRKGRRNNGGGKEQIERFIVKRVCISFLGTLIFFFCAPFAIAGAFIASQLVQTPGQISFYAVPMVLLLFCIGWAGGVGGLWLKDAAIIGEKKFLFI